MKPNNVWINKLTKSFWHCLKIFLRNNTWSDAKNVPVSPILLYKYTQHMSNFFFLSDNIKIFFFLDRHNKINCYGGKKQGFMLPPHKTSCLNKKTQKRFYDVILQFIQFFWSFFPFYLKTLF
jgi:hypothetical protein